jgi:hypothetical protein
MRSRVVTGLAIAAVLVATGAAMLARAEVVAERPDLTGHWRLDPKRSDTMKAPGDGQQRGPRGGGSGGGPPGGGGGFGGGPPGGGGGFGGGPPGEGQDGSSSGGTRGTPPRPLPDLMHVTDSERLISFEDSTGAVLQEITVLASEGEKDTLMHAPGALVLAGRWKDTKLEATHSARGGMKLTQAITFEGDTVLIVRTKMSGSDRMPASEFKRFYRRVKGD